MEVQDLIRALEQEWDPTNSGGFFTQLSWDHYDEMAFDRIVKILGRISLENDCIEKRVVELIWFMPTYMHWQRDGWQGNETDIKRLDAAITLIEQRLTTILGLP